MRFMLPIAVLAVVVIGGLGIAGIGPAATLMGGMTGEAEESAVPGPKVKRGPMVIAVTQRGNLSAKNSIQIRNELEGRTTILSMIQEGTMVEEGELLVELDVSNMEERRVQQGISVQNSQAAHTKAVQQLEIQDSQNQSDIARGERLVDFAQIDEDKYLNGDWLQTLKSADESITLAKEELAQADKRLTDSIKLNEEGFLTDNELETDRLALTRRKISLEQSNRAKELLEKYDFPKQKKALAADIEETKRELDRIKLQAKARLVDFEATVNTSKARLDLEVEELAKIKDQISKAKIFAPEPGIVVYARQKSRWGSGDPIAEGTELHERQEIITIPREGGMIVEASLHETVIKKVEAGQKCTVTIDAMPGRAFEGEVRFVALLPDSNSFWANPNQRLFKTEIGILNPIPEMRPGMSCKVEILVDSVEDAMQVPVQTVFRNGGKTVCFVEDSSGVKEVPVKVGRDNDKWVEVLEGLSVGQTVLMAPPTGFKLEPAPAYSQRPPGAGGPSGGEQGGRSSGAEKAGRPSGGESGSRSGQGGRPGGTKGKTPSGPSGKKPGGTKGATPKESSNK
jgi:HlyD family secretion protein